MPVPQPDTLPDDYAADVAAVQAIDVVPTILDVVCKTTGMGFAAVARVTEHRWVACAVRDDIGFGLTPGGELELRSTICHEIRQTGQLVVIDDVQADTLFRDHHTPLRYGFRSYISVPIHRPEGDMFGTLCAIDPQPARLKDAGTVDMFRLFARLIGLHLDTHDRLTASAAALTSASARAELQQQFVSVLTHDLRNPLAASQTAVTLLLKIKPDERIDKLARIIERSIARMATLVDNVMDFARIRLGGGLPLERRDVPDLPHTLDHVIAELSTSQPHRQIRSDVRLSGSVYCDPARLGQLLSNLLSNALTHGDARAPVTVTARNDDGFELAVSNSGPRIPPETIDQLFQPYVRGDARTGAEGLGLGLHIASQIARAHGATLSASSTDDSTTFTFRMRSPIAGS